MAISRPPATGQVQLHCGLTHSDIISVYSKMVGVVLPDFLKSGMHTVRCPRATSVLSPTGTTELFMYGMTR
jgi:hypothetical protein